MAVTNRRLAPLFSYRGEFTCDFVDVEHVLAAVKPVREEARL